jgi:hypothetical protein
LFFGSARHHKKTARREPGSDAFELQRTNEIIVTIDAMSAAIPPKNRSTDFPDGEVLGGSSNPFALRVHPLGVVYSMSAPPISINYE